MALQFHRAVADIGIWSATSDGFSFVVSYASPTGDGLHGHPGFMASWRPLYQNKTAIRITGSPFKSIVEAEDACDAMLKHLTSD
jgi:hypothetical protein